MYMQTNASMIPWKYTQQERIQSFIRPARCTVLCTTQILIEKIFNCESFDTHPKQVLLQPEYRTKKISTQFAAFFFKF